MGACEIWYQSYLGVSLGDLTAVVFHFHGWCRDGCHAAVECRGEECCRLVSGVLGDVDIGKCIVVVHSFGTVNKWSSLITAQSGVAFQVLVGHYLVYVHR